MDTNNENKTMNTKRNDDFQTAWERRKQNWQQQAEKTLPDDATLLRLAETARQQAQQQTAVVVPLTRPRKRWIPYAAAACIAVGVTVIGLTRQSQADNVLPVAEEVTVGGQTIHFLCNKGCSAQDVMLSANEVIK
jgi:hypothetical protein